MYTLEISKHGLFITTYKCKFGFHRVRKIFVIAAKGFEPGTSCVKDQDATAVAARDVRLRIFKLTPIHA